MSNNFALTTFSSTGKLGQIEHALAAVNNGPMSVGIKASNGVVIATEKKLPSSLMISSTLEKVVEVTTNVGMVYSGMGSDYRVLVNKGRKQAQSYLLTYKEDMPVLQSTRGIAGVMQEFTQSGGVRPFGVSLLVAGYDEVRDNQLFQIDPSGAYFAWKATAIGKGSDHAKTFLEKWYQDDMDLADAIDTAILTLKDGFNGEMTEETIEIGVVDQETKQFRVMTTEEVGDHLANLN
eukprot:TRINITY_DN601_c0_g1_i12.p1 TRINITY_DN601_c0_g1~~TRINITY_DN601_c0_g1_i12.p1  ORF type:complete len:235 (-),score=71.98 TRINITY_DN601_c0_g1_i12:331-1035(-)